MNYILLLTLFATCLADCDPKHYEESPIRFYISKSLVIQGAPSMSINIWSPDDSRMDVMLNHKSYYDLKVPTKNTGVDVVRDSAILESDNLISGICVNVMRCTIDNIDFLNPSLQYVVTIFNRNAIYDGVYSYYIAGNCNPPANDTAENYSNFMKQSSHIDNTCNNYNMQGDFTIYNHIMYIKYQGYDHLSATVYGLNGATFSSYTVDADYLSSLGTTIDTTLLKSVDLSGGQCYHVAYCNTQFDPPDREATYTTVYVNENATHSNTFHYNIKLYCKHKLPVLSYSSSVEIESQDSIFVNDLCYNNYCLQNYWWLLLSMILLGCVVISIIPCLFLIYSVYKCHMASNIYEDPASSTQNDMIETI